MEKTEENSSDPTEGKAAYGTKAKKVCKQQQKRRKRLESLNWEKERGTGVREENLARWLFKEKRTEWVQIKDGGSGEKEVAGKKMAAVSSAL